MIMEPKVSVIIPTYNRDGTITHAIESVLNQTYKNLEVIVVDDNSNDNTENVVKLIQDKRLRYFKNLSNLGPSGARNRGILEARGEFISFQDSDDIWVQDKLQKQMSYFEKHQDVGMVYCAFGCREGNLVVKSPSDQYPTEKLSGDIYQILLQGNKVGTPTMLIKRQCLDVVGLFNSNLKAWEDYELALRIAKQYKIGYVNEVLVNVNRSESGVNSNNKNVLDASIYIANTYFIGEDKSLLGNITRNIVMRINLLTNEAEKEEYIKRIDPIIKSCEIDYEFISSEIDAKNKFKENYNLACKLLEVYNSLQTFQCFLKSRKINSCGIYGAGKIAKSLIRVLRLAGVEVQFIVDQNEVHIEGIKSIKMEDITDEPSIIITTIPNDRLVKSKLKLYSQCEIISLGEFLNEFIKEL